MFLVILGGFVTKMMIMFPLEVAHNTMTAISEEAALVMYVMLATAHIIFCKRIAVQTLSAMTGKTLLHAVIVNCQHLAPQHVLIARAQRELCLT
jgi:hypothetical protein